METYYSQLTAQGGKLPSGAALNVTGYSLGGHLATVFTELHAVAVNHTYVFNSAGTGYITGISGQSTPDPLDPTPIQNMLDYLTQVLLDPRVANENNPLPDDPYAAVFAQAIALHDADPSWNPFQSGSTADLYQDPRYVWAVHSVALQYATILGPSTVAQGGAFDKITQLFGNPTGGDLSVVANSGIHATPTPVFIQGQPILENLGRETDFGNAHAIVLIVDSLALMNLFLTVDPTKTQADLESIFAASSNEMAKLITFAGDPNAAEGDSLANALDALRTVFIGPDIQPTPVDASGGGFGNIANRNTFYQNIADVEAALGGQTFQIVSLGPYADAIKMAAEQDTDDGLAYRYALKELNPFAVLGADYSTSGKFTLFDADNTGVGLTAEYLSDRAQFLEEKVAVNIADAAQSGGYIHFVDRTMNYEIQTDSIITIDQEFIFGDDRGDTIAGGSADDHLYGDAGNDTITGGSGNDYLEGDAGNDLLEGGAGYDTYNYKIGGNLGTINDSDGQGIILYDTHPVDGGIRQDTDPANTYRGGNQGAMTYVWDGPGTDLTINNLITVQDFQNGDLGIHLTQEPNLLTSPPTIDFSNTLPLRTLYETLVTEVFYPPTERIDQDPIVLIFPQQLTPSNDPSGSYNYDNDPQNGSIPVFWNGYVVDSSPPIAFQVTGDAYLDLHLTGSGFAQGGLGNDRLYAGDGDAALIGGSGNDQLFGGAGNNSLDGGNGDDYLVGGGGNDTLIGRAGNNVLVASTGNDLMYGWGPYFLSVNPPPPPPPPGGGEGDGGGLPPPPPPLGQPAPPGHNYLIGSSGNATMISGPGDDTLDVRSSGNALLEGGAGTNAILFGRGSGRDTLDDVEVGRAGTGNAPGTDIIHFAADVTPGDVTVTADNNLGLVLGITGTTAQLTVSQFFASSYPQIIQVAFADGTVLDAATLTAMELASTDRNDSLVGTPRNDRIFGGKGDDTLNGGGGSDTYIFNLGDGMDTLIDSTVDGGSNTVIFGTGITPDSISLGLGSLLIRYGDQGDAIHIPNFDPNDAYDSHAVDTYQFAGGTVLSYSQLIDRGFDLVDTDDSDLMLGTNVVDRIAGMGGDDTLVGGQGNDALSGGSGDDTYSFNWGDGVDTIHDVSTMGKCNSILFGDGITQADLAFTQNQANHTLTIAYDAEGDAIQLTDFDQNNFRGSLVVRTLEFSDGSLLNMTDLFQPTDVNHAPTVTNPLVGQNAPEDTPFNFVLPANTFADADAVFGDRLTLSASLDNGQTLPEWLGFDALTGTFRGTPGNADVGSINIKLTATDSGNFSATDIFGLTVTNVNEAPTVANPLEDRSTFEDSPFSFQVLADTFADEDAGDHLALRATLDDGNPLPAWLSFDVSTETFSGTPNDADVGNLSLKVTATDSGNLSASNTFGLTVVNVNETPVMVHPLADQTTAQDTPFSLAVPVNTFADEDIGDTRTYSAMLADGHALPAWLGFNAATGTFSGTPHSGDVGSISVKLTVTDSGNLSASAIFVLSVTVAGGQRVTGTWRNDVITTGAGNDVIDALGGSDTVDSGAGDDTINGGGGSDTIAAGVGNDTIRGGEGADHITAGEGNNTVKAGSGNDVVSAGAGNDVISGGDGSDTINAGDGMNQIDGGSGNDIITAGTGNDTIAGGTGSDTLTGGKGNDMLNGGAGNDTFVFGRGDGQDTVKDSLGSDTMLFNAVINPLDLVLSRQINDLRLAIHGSTDRVTIQNWYTVGTSKQTETIQAGNGEQLANTQADQLIQAMAGFSAQSGLSWDQAIDQRPQDVQPILAASWH